MKSFGIILLCFWVQVLYGQEFRFFFKNPKDSSQNFYVVRPPKGNIKGLLVLNDRSLSDSSKKKAYEKGIFILTVVPSSNPLENLTNDTIVYAIGSMVKEVMNTYKIPKNRLIIGGMSAAGTGAIRYTQHCYVDKTQDFIKPIAVFAVDAPLDYERLWNESEKSVQRNFNEDAFKEGKYLMNFLKKRLNSTPKSNIKKYREKSPFCYSALNGGNAYMLNQLAVRLYIEPDIEWWINNRRKDFYDINATDSVGLINQLRLNGNDKAELIVSSGKGYREDGKRHPHSWSILNETDLLSWCESLFAEIN